MSDLFIIETKFAATDSGEIEGTAWKFSTPDRIGDVIEKSAIANVSLPLPMLFGHDHNDPVGSWESMSIVGDNLNVKGHLLIDTVPRAREIHSLVKAGAIRGLSISFVTRKSTGRKGSVAGRTIHELEMLEASLVVVPMHPGAKITSAKTAVEAIKIAAAINRTADRLRNSQ